MKIYLVWVQDEYNNKEIVHVSKTFEGALKHIGLEIDDYNTNLIGSPRYYRIEEQEIK